MSSHTTLHCRIAFIKPSTDPEDKSETPHILSILQFIDLLNKNRICTRLENYHNSE